MQELFIEILNLSSKELQDAKQIYKYTKEMSSHIEQEDMDALTHVIALRQKWMEQTEDTGIRVQEKLKELKSKYAHSLEEINDKKEVRDILENRRKRKEIYKSAYEVEQENQALLSKLLEKYKVRIMGIQQGKEAFLKYGKGNKAGQSIMINSLK